MVIDSRTWARKIIDDRFKIQKLIAETYKETLRFLLGTFGSLKIIDPQGEVLEVPCITASPERTVAKLYQEENITLPLITVLQSTTKESEKRRKPNVVGLINSEQYWDSSRMRALRVISLAPKAIDIIYDINIWSKYNEEMDQLAEQIRLLFSPNLRVITKYTNSTPAYITNESNDSQTVVADRQDRIIRRKFEVTIEGYIPYPKYLVTSTGEITEFNAEWQVISDSSIDLDSSSIAASSITSEIGTFTEK